MAGTTKPNVVKAENPGVARVARGGYKKPGVVKAESPGVAWVAHDDWDHKTGCGENRKSGCGIGGARWLGPHGRMW